MTHFEPPKTYSPMFIPVTNGLPSSVVLSSINNEFYQVYEILNELAKPKERNKNSK